MRVINHIEEDVNPEFLDDDEKWLDNRQEPIVRKITDVVGDKIKSEK